jgi:FkbM family methyltransferase
MFPILSLLPGLPRLKIVDVGAMSLGPGSPPPYARLLAAVPCDVVGFEPVARECEKLNREAAPGQTFLPHFIGDGRRHTFHECNYSMTSSLLPPNSALLEKFQNLENLTRVVSRSEVETTRLDDLPGVQGTDLLKVDVQGGELMVYQGAERTLNDVLVIQSEVEFVPLYKDQPLFADIDQHLRARGFCFHRFHKVSGRTLKPLVYQGNVNAVMSQMLWADAIYVRDFMAFDRLAPGMLLKLAVILHENYRSYDLAALALQAHDRQQGGDLHARYLARLQTGPRQAGAQPPASGGGAA